MKWEDNTVNDACKYDPYWGYELIHGESPVPNGQFCYYEDNTLCMYAEESDDGGAFCKKHHCKLFPGYYKLPQCE